MAELEGAIAVTRFGMGARPGEIKAASSDPRGWLKAQVKADAALTPADGLLSTKQVMTERQEAYGGRPPGAPGPDGKPTQANEEQIRMIRQMAQKETREGLFKEVDARAKRAATTTDPFTERWARFWANHFTVAAKNIQTIGLVGPYEREAIRPHVFGSFAGLLGHASFHPGMLVYLDAARSFGPSTEVAQRRKAGLNENLAREILELHTLGVGSGYTQADIIEFAKALTGWTTGGPQIARLAGLGANPKPRQLRQLQRAGGGAPPGMGDQHIGEAVFVEALHEPGTRTVLGKAYTQDGRAQAAAILDDVAQHPATAKHIAHKLVKHFVADDPPAAAVAKVEAAFNASRGDLSAVARAVIDLPEAWAPQQRKFKTPDDLLVSVARSMGGEAAFGPNQRGVYQALAQQPFSAPSPAGWADDTASWSGSDAVLKRIEWANAVSRRMSRGMSPTDFLDSALGPLAGEATRKAVSRAESAEQGFTLALMSPEFQRR
jgi:uncharacterized protein (DUF1800 family)